MDYKKVKLGDHNDIPQSIWSTDDNIICEDNRTLRDNLNDKLDDVTIKVNGNTYTHANGTITLPDYPTSTGDGHTHSNKDVLDSITSTKVSNWDSAIPFNNSTATDANAWLTNGYIKTGADTANLPSVLSSYEKYGILFFLAENSANGTGTQMFFPIDGTYKGRIFTRSLVAMNTTPQAGEWYMLSTFDGNYNSLSNLPTIPSLDGYATETYVTDAISNAVVSTANGITIEDTAGNFTATNVEGALAELFQNVSNGKTLIASAITDKGVTTSNEATFQQMATNISSISTGEVNVGDEIMTLSNKEVVLDRYQDRIMALPLDTFANALSNATIWQNFGDSISSNYNISINEAWHNLIGAESAYSSITRYNNALTGSEISDGGRNIDSFVERYTSLNSNANLVTVFGGVNDWIHNNIPLGNYDDATTSQSFYGALNTLLPGIKTQCPNARVIFILPLRVRTGYLANDVNNFGLTLQDYRQAIKNKCIQYGVDYIDLWNAEGLNPDINTGNFQSDGLHPTASGHVVLKNYLINNAKVRMCTETEYKPPAEVITYTITNNLTNVTNSNSASRVNENASYSATITANDGYELSAITVTMGGTNITSTAVNGGTITIANVTGNIVITATATQTSSGGGGTGTGMSFPATATFNSLVNRNTAYFCVVVDVSNLKDGDSVVASWTGSEASVWSGSFNNSADPWYCTESELRNVTGTNDSRIKASGKLTKLTGDLLSGTSTTIIKSPGANYKYLRIQVPINNPHLPGTWTISNMTVTVNGTTNLPILNIGGFFVNSNIVITH